MAFDEMSGSSMVVGNSTKAGEAHFDLGNLFANPSVLDNLTKTGETQVDVEDPWVSPFLLASTSTLFLVAILSLLSRLAFSMVAERQRERKRKRDADSQLSEPFLDPDADRSEPEQRAPDTFELTIEGMHCATCSNTIEKSLKEVPGVQTAVVNLMSSKAEIAGLGVNVGELVEAVEDVGFDVPQFSTRVASKSIVHKETHTLEVTGMSCASCARKVETACAHIDGVDSVVVDFLGSKVIAVATRKGLEAVEKEIRELGYGTTLLSSRPPPEGPLDRPTQQPVTRTTLGISGMTCSNCEGVVRNALMGVQGVHSAAVDFVGARAVITWAEGRGRSTQRRGSLDYDIASAMEAVRFFLNHSAIVKKQYLCKTNS